MTKENVKRLHALIVERGSFIHDKLPQHESRPSGRIGIAHIYSVIKAVMGVPMKECSDSRVDDIIEIVNYCVYNVSENDLLIPLLKKYKKEPVYEPVSLDKFF